VEASSYGTRTQIIEGLEVSNRGREAAMTAIDRSAFRRAWKHGGMRGARVAFREK
jgi:hypothetical protein